MLGHEILLAILGHPGDLFSPPPFMKTTTNNKAPSPCCYQCTPHLHSLLSLSERTLIERLISRGYKIAHLRSFVLEISSSCYDNTTTKTTLTSLYVQAVSRAISKRLSCYEDKIFELERELLERYSHGTTHSSSSSSLGYIEAVTGIDRPWIDNMHSLVIWIQYNISSNKSSSDDRHLILWDELYHRRRLLADDNDDNNNATGLKELHDAVWNVYCRQIESWVRWGVILENDNDFFIQRRRDKQQQQRQPRHMMKEEEEEEENDYVLNVTRIPTPAISLDLAQRILSIGKGIRLLSLHHCSNSSSSSPTVDPLINNTTTLPTVVNCTPHSLPPTISLINSHISTKLYHLFATPLSSQLQNFRQLYLLGDETLFFLFLEQCREFHFFDENPERFKKMALERRVMRSVWEREWSQREGEEYGVMKKQWAVVIHSKKESFELSRWGARRRVDAGVGLSGRGVMLDEDTECLMFTNQKEEGGGNWLYSVRKREMRGGMTTNVSFQFLSSSEEVFLEDDDRIDIKGDLYWCLTTRDFSRVISDDVTHHLQHLDSDDMMIVRFSRFQKQETSYLQAAIINVENSMNHPIPLSSPNTLLTISIDITPNGEISIYFMSLTQEKQLMSRCPSQPLFQNSPNSLMATMALTTNTPLLLSRWSFHPHPPTSSSYHPSLTPTILLLSQNSQISLTHLTQKLSWFSLTTPHPTLTLDYKLPRNIPLHLVLSPSSIERTYNPIFFRLFSLLSLVGDIRSLWMRTHVDVVIERQRRRRWDVRSHLLRQRMYFFWNTYLNHLQRMIASLYQQFRRVLMLSSSSKENDGHGTSGGYKDDKFHSVLHAHGKFLGSLRRCCFLDDEEVTMRLGRIQAITLTFVHMGEQKNKEMMDDDGDDDNDEEWKESIKLIASDFDKEVGKLFLLLEKRIDVGLDLCTSLDFNGWISSNI